MNRTHVMTGGRYPVLRALGILYVIAAVAILGLGVWAIGWSLFAAPARMSERFLLAGQAVVATFIAIITVLAIAEVIKLLIDVEHNTRMAAIRGTTAALATETGAAVITTTTGGDGSQARATAAGGRMAELDEESAEAALLRGH
ncbi:MAG TPA: hypothetical protein VH475_16865 [Tepidisphaeraceae bacterium]|jgi:hypothetical protein